MAWVDYSSPDEDDLWIVDYRQQVSSIFNNNANNHHENNANNNENNANTNQLDNNNQNTISNSNNRSNSSNRGIMYSSGTSNHPTNASLSTAMSSKPQWLLDQPSSSSSLPDTISQQLNDVCSDGDITLSCSDGISCKAHAQLLALHSPVLKLTIQSAASSSDGSKQISVSETSAEWSLLLAAVYLPESEDVFNIDAAHTLARLAKRYRMKRLLKLIGDCIIVSGPDWHLLFESRSTPARLRTPRGRGLHVPIVQRPVSSQQEREAFLSPNYIRNPRHILQLLHLAQHTQHAVAKAYIADLLQQHSTVLCQIFQGAVYAEFPEILQSIGLALVRACASAMRRRHPARLPLGTLAPHVVETDARRVNWLDADHEGTEGGGDRDGNPNISNVSSNRIAERQAGSGHATVVDTDTRRVHWLDLDCEGPDGGVDRDGSRNGNRTGERQGGGGHGSTAGERDGSTAVDRNGGTAGERSGGTAGERSGSTAGERSGGTAVDRNGSTAGERSGGTAGERSGGTAGSEPWNDMDDYDNESRSSSVEAVVNGVSNAGSSSVAGSVGSGMPAGGCNQARDTKAKARKNGRNSSSLATGSTHASADVAGCADAGNVSNASNAGNMSNPSAPGNVSNASNAGNMGHAGPAGNVSNAGTAGNVSHASSAGSISNPASAELLSMTSDGDIILQCRRDGVTVRAHMCVLRQQSDVLRDMLSEPCSLNAIPPPFSNPAIPSFSNPAIAPHFSNPAMAPHFSNPAIAPHFSNPAMAPHFSNPAMAPHVSNPAIAASFSNPVISSSPSSSASASASSSNHPVISSSSNNPAPPSSSNIPPTPPFNNPPTSFTNPPTPPFNIPPTSSFTIPPTPSPSPSATNPAILSVDDTSIQWLAALAVMYPLDDDGGCPASMVHPVLELADKYNMVAVKRRVMAHWSAHRNLAAMLKEGMSADKMRDALKLLSLCSSENMENGGRLCESLLAEEYLGRFFEVMIDGREARAPVLSPAAWWLVVKKITENARGW